ncbi:hypothetical protein MCAP1_000193 [Malassezia caprae]|uniref:Uncharacterized protein n=1 Tax=Malassezia caprae TaxID=1381934 RepID=A0AAF0E206_9BASI|nr:hypothetical protein MCAP1_000193 [Malassezia caprae]
MTARKAPPSPSAKASHPPPSLLSAVQKTGSSLAPVTAPVVSHPAPMPEIHRGSPRQRQDASRRHPSHTQAHKEPASILVESEEGPSELETQLLASLERDAERKGTAAEPVPRPTPHVYFGEERVEDAPVENVYPYETRQRPAHTDALPVPATRTATLLRPVRVSFGVTWEWHIMPLWPKMPDASLARLGNMAHGCVYDALLYQLDSVDRPAMHRRPWTVARSVLVWVPQSVLWWMYRHLPSPSSACSHTPRYPVWVAPMDAPQRTGQWHLAALTLPIMLLWRADALVAALLDWR